MAVFRLYNDRHQFFDNAGDPLANGRLFLYLAGSSTKQASYNSILGTIANSNPLILDGFGRLQSEVWLTAGVLYKALLADAAPTPGADDPPLAPFWSENNISGIGDSNITSSEWIDDATLVPTFISGTSFSVPGDKTSIMTSGRRLKVLDSGGTKYGTIISSAFTTLTTVTVAMDSTALASPITSVSYSFADPINPSISADLVHRKATAIASAATTNIWAIAGDMVHVTGSTGPITSLGTASYAGDERTVIFDSTPTLTHNATTLQLPGGANIVVQAGDRMVVKADTTANMVVISYTRAAFAPTTGKQPTIQTFLSGSGTYTTPAGATRLFVRLIGGGGGGSGSGSAPGNGGNGVDTTFSTLTAAKGSGSVATAGGNGGTGTNGDINITGAMGQTSSGSANQPGGSGAPTYFGGAGAGGGGVTNTSGQAAIANTGAGGGGGGCTATTSSGGGGGAGAYVEKTIVAPAATYSYAVGTAGAAGTTGSVAPGGAGGSGIIIVQEFYS